MFEQKTLTKKIDELFVAHGKNSPDQLKFFIDQLHQNSAVCGRTVMRCFILLIAIWIASVLVAYGAIAEAQLSSLKLKNVKLFFLLVPPALGFIGHHLCTTLNHGIHLRDGLDRSYKHFLPMAY